MVETFNFLEYLVENVLSACLEIGDHALLFGVASYQLVGQITFLEIGFTHFDEGIIDFVGFLGNLVFQALCLLLEEVNGVPTIHLDDLLDVLFVVALDFDDLGL